MKPGDIPGDSVHQALAALAETIDNDRRARLLIELGIVSLLIDQGLIDLSVLEEKVRQVQRQMPSRYCHERIDANIKLFLKVLSAQERRARERAAAAEASDGPDAADPDGALLPDGEILPDRAEELDAGGNPSPVAWVPTPVDELTAPPVLARRAAVRAVVPIRPLRPPRPARVAPSPTPHSDDAHPRAGDDKATPGPGRRPRGR